MPQPLLFRMIDKAVYDYNLIEKGDKILVGASGGKDSTALIQYFARRKLRPQEDFTYTALHVQSEITPPLNTELQQLFDKWNVPVGVPPNVVLSYSVTHLITDIQSWH